MRPAIAVSFVLAALTVVLRADAGAAISSSYTEESEMADLSRIAVDLNSAGYEDLLAVPGMSVSDARAIVSRRSALGCIRSFDDLLGAGGLDPLDLARIRPYVSLGAGCRRTGRYSLGGTFGWWVQGGGVASRRGASAWAGDLLLGTGPARLRVRGRSSQIGAHGGVILRSDRGAVALGDMRGRLAHPIAVEIGRGTLDLDGAAPARPMTARSKAQPRSCGSLQITTGTGERIRGIGLEIYSKTYAVGFVGEFLGAWDGRARPLGLVSLRLVERCGLELWSGAVGWDRPASGSGYIATSWTNGPARGSAGVAVRGSGAAWLVELCAEPNRGRRLGVSVAGRLGRYDSPVGVGAFRKPGDPAIASRVTVSQGVWKLCNLSYEDVMESGGEASSLRRAVRLKRRLNESLWWECEVRAYGESGSAAELRPGLKVLWKTSRRGWSELIYKSRMNGRSTMVGWRASVCLGRWEVEWGGFSFRASKSLYFYETEIVGLSSIKALKGEGLGWYLCMRLEPPEGAGPLYFLGSAELKVRMVLGRDSPLCGTFVGLQVGRR